MEKAAVDVDDTAGGIDQLALLAAIGHKVAAINGDMRTAACPHGTTVGGIVITAIDHYGAGGLGINDGILFIGMIGTVGGKDRTVTIECQLAVVGNGEQVGKAAILLIVMQGAVVQIQGIIPVIPDGILPACAVLLIRFGGF